MDYGCLEKKPAVIVRGRKLTDFTSNHEALVLSKNPCTINLVGLLASKDDEMRVSG